MKLLFLDESGDHNLTIIDKNYPLFVLAGCVIDDNYHKNILTPRLSEFKRKLFNTEDIILHYVDYTRNRKGFEIMINKKFRENFFKGLNDVIKNTDFILVACIIDKKKHKKKYGILALDPYIFSLEIVIERFVMYLKEKDEKGVIIAESRGQQLDNELELSFLNFKIRGTRFLRPKEIVEKIDSFIIKKKEENIAGLQLADTLVTPIGRRYLNKVNYINYEIIKSKFRRSSCERLIGYGLIILPKK